MFNKSEFGETISQTSHELGYTSAAEKRYTKDVVALLEDFTGEMITRVMASEDDIVFDSGEMVLHLLVGLLVIGAKLNITETIAGIDEDDDAIGLLFTVATCHGIHNQYKGVLTKLINKAENTSNQGDSTSTSKHEPLNESMQLAVDFIIAISQGKDFDEESADPLSAYSNAFSTAHSYIVSGEALEFTAVRSKWQRLYERATVSVIESVISSAHYSNLLLARNAFVLTLIIIKLLNHDSKYFDYLCTSHKNKEAILIELDRIAGNLIEEFSFDDQVAMFFANDDMLNEVVLTRELKRLTA